MTNKEICPICGNQYKEESQKDEYHVSYKPEVTTDACLGCNYAEYLIRHPEVKPPYDMEKRKEIVKQWTLKNRPLIS